MTCTNICEQVAHDIPQPVHLAYYPATPTATAPTAPSRFGSDPPARAAAKLTPAPANGYYAPTEKPSAAGN